MNLKLAASGISSFTLLTINNSKAGVEGRLHDQFLQSFELGVGSVWSETKDDALGGCQESSNLKIKYEKLYKKRGELVF